MFEYRPDKSLGFLHEAFYTRLFFSKIGIEWGTYYSKKVPNFEIVCPSPATPWALAVKGVYVVSHSYYEQLYEPVCNVESFFQNNTVSSNTVQKVLDSIKKRGFRKKFVDKWKVKYYLLIEEIHFLHIRFVQFKLDVLFIQIWTFITVFFEAVWRLKSDSKVKYDRMRRIMMASSCRHSSNTNSDQIDPPSEPREGCV